MLYPCAMLLTALPQLNLKVDDPIDMLPKSRKALSIQEIAALARSSFNGISQVVKDHVTKPTAMAQGRVAHLIEWKGWSKPLDPPSATLQSHFNSYSHLSEGEQEARFAAGVAEQFAIAEAKLRAWTSVDEEDMDEESFEDNPPLNDEQIITNQSSGAVLSNQSCPVPIQTETDNAESQSILRLSDTDQSMQEPCSAQIDHDDLIISEEVPQGDEEVQLSGEEADGGIYAIHKPERRPLWSKGDSCYYSTSYSESGLSPEEEEDGREVEEGEDNVFQEVICWDRHCRSISDTSGGLSFDEDEAEEEQEEGSKQ
ncbi:protein FAM131A-like isoform X2 [Myxocyprinus asiaticus]|uniref:protein FAM131A-like isoform X2 n=1 Tax=Myxocyprinus asiaticus TaxID=70543 RepID=UPI002223E47F|nr:protein FAM131A-like isoform X2 [Myxocyprinus asiaticus]